MINYIANYGNAGASSQTSPYALQNCNFLRLFDANSFGDFNDNGATGVTNVASIAWITVTAANASFRIGGTNNQSAPNAADLFVGQMPTGIN